jgi:hypothetical protein
MKCVLVAENDKLVPLPTHKDACSKRTSTHVAYLRQAGIPVLYSCDKGKELRYAVFELRHTVIGYCHG